MRVAQFSGAGRALRRVCAIIRCMAQDYDIHTDDKFGSLTLIDVAAEAAAHEPWFNQTLTTVNDSVVRLGRRLIAALIVSQILPRSAENLPAGVFVTIDDAGNLGVLVFKHFAKKEDGKWRYVVDHASANPAASPSPSP